MNIMSAFSPSISFAIVSGSSESPHASLCSPSWNKSQTCTTISSSFGSGGTSSSVPTPIVVPDEKFPRSIFSSIPCDVRCPTKSEDKSHKS